jgi:homoserine dehydrogenase
MQKITLGILGLGTVGGGTVNVLKRNAELIARRANAQIEVKSAVVRSLDSERICDCSGISLSTDPAHVLNDPEIDVVVELIGGDTLAKECVEKAIANGKHVVTANKALIAKYGNELFAAAEKNNVSIAYEASVAGGIGIIKALREGLAGNDIEFIAGIINGTGNFILTEMLEKGRDFADVLAEAQELGYAEADPTFDVEGIDAAHKLAILAAIGYGMPINFDAVYTQGISGLSLEDLNYAKELGYRIKHLGIAKSTDHGVELRVHPTLIPEKRLLANVDGVMNAVLVRGDAVGNTLHYGAGAGAEPTASAVVADIVDLARRIQSGASNQEMVPHLGFTTAGLQERKTVVADDFICSFYIRLSVNDEAGVMAEVTKVFAEHNISIEAVIQKEPAGDQKIVQIILLTHECQERLLDQSLENIQTLTSVQAPAVKIRVEHLN